MSAYEHVPSPGARIQGGGYVEEREVNAALRRFELEHSIKLDPTTAQEMGELMELQGWEAADAYAEVSPAPEDFEAAFESRVAHHERKAGRTLLDSAVDRLWTNAVDPPAHRSTNGERNTK